MQRLAFFFLGALIVTLGVDAPPVRPADGTYVYTLTGIHGLTTSTVVIRTNGATVSTTETLSVVGEPVVATTDYDTTTLLPTHYHLLQGGKTTDIAFAGTSATFVTVPPATFYTNAGADPLMIGDGLVAYVAMMPSVLAAHPATPISVLAINGGVRVFTVASARAEHIHSVDIPAGDIGSAAIDMTSGAKFSFWTNPQTHATDAIERGGFRIRLASRTDSTAPVTPAPQATPYPIESPNYDSRDVTFASSGATLAGTISVPRGPANRRYPAFVFIHGSGPGTRDGALAANPTFLLLGNRLANAGYVVLRYDKRGIGKSTGTGSESWKPLGDDARAAVAYLRAQSSVDPRHIFLLGHSEGGIIAPLIAPSIHPAPAGIVMMAGPAISMAHIFDEQLAGVSPSVRAQYEAPFGDYAGLEPTAYITKVAVPILVLQGTRDIQVLAKDLPPMIAAARKAKRNITVRVLDGDDHLFIRVPATAKADGSEYFVPAPLDPRVPEAILKWAKSIP